MIRLRTLGACSIQCGQRYLAPDAEILFAILLVLAVERGKEVPRERLRLLLWPRADESQGQQRLRQALYKLKQHHGIDFEINGSTVRLSPAQVEADYSRLFDAGWENLFLTAAPESGEFLPGYTPSFSAPFAEWVEVQRDLVHNRLRLAIVAAIHQRKSRGEWREVELLARRCLEFDPLSEDATLALAEAIALGGNRADAIALLDGYLIELGPGPHEYGVHAGALRRRIAERLPADPYLRTTEGAFVGRGESMLVLYECARRTQSGVSTSAFIWGEPGIGKSRLVDEFCRGAIVSGAIVRRVASQASDVQRPLSLFADLAPHLMQLPGALGCSPESLSYLRRLSSLDATDAAASGDAAEAESRAGMIRRAIFDLFDAVASECRLLVVFEDVHWSDPGSLRLLREIIAWGGTRQLQFVMTSRTPPAPEVQGGSELADRLLVHRLSALDPPAAAELLRKLATSRGREAADGFLTWGVRVAEGNPFYLRELLGHWLETGELYSVPPTLASLLANRIAALEPREMRLLQACAVLRRHGRLDRLRALLGYENLEMIESLEKLGGAGLIVAEGEHTECRHELIADAALTQLSDAARQALYRMAAELLEGEAAGAGATGLAGL